MARREKVQVATGLPQTSGQHSATRIQALFTAQDLPGNKVVFFIRQVIRFVT